MNHQLVRVNPLTFINLGMAIAIFVLALFYVLKGRKEDKPIMLVNAYTGLWASIAIGLILYDRVIFDIFDEHTTRWLISSTMLVILGSKLGNLIRLGRRNHNDH